MSCNYCWPGNCCGGPNCEHGKRVPEMTDERATEAAARAMFDVSPFNKGEGPFEKQSENYKMMCRMLAKVALAAAGRVAATNETEQLRTALKPFADAAPEDGEYLRPVRLVYDPSGDKGSLSPEDFLNARKAIDAHSTPDQAERK